MMRIVRTTTRKGKTTKKDTRGPFLTECPIRERGPRVVAVRLRAGELEIKAAGLKHWYAIPYDALYWVAVRRSESARTLARKAARKSAKKAVACG